MHQMSSVKQQKRRIPPNVQLWLSIFLILFGLHLCSGLTSESRGELARKFKYYHKSVRPGDRFNLIETINGTFFALHTEVELLQTRPNKDRLETEMFFNLYYNDERLTLRDIDEVIAIPDEFSPWTPQLDFPDNTNLKSSIHVDPRTGQVSLRFKLHTMLECTFIVWNSPFQKYFCRFEVGSYENEKIFPRIIRDLRTKSDVDIVQCSIEQFPTFAIICHYRNRWLPVVLNTYLPSFLIFAIAVFSQWKRRKLQVLVTLASLITLILLLKRTKDHEDNFTLEDLWLISTFMHIVALLCIDLVVPARRIIQTTYSVANEKLNSSTTSNHAGFSNRSTEPITTTSYRDAKQRFLRPYALSNRPSLGTSEERSVFLEMPPNKPIHYDLSDIELADEDADDDNADLQQMRTTYVHIQRPNPTFDTSPSINIGSRKQTGSLNISTTTVTSPTTAIIRRKTSGSTANRSQYCVTKMTLGTKKKLALISIVGCYMLFLVAYILILMYLFY